MTHAAAAAAAAGVALNDARMASANTTEAMRRRFGSSASLRGESWFSLKRWPQGAAPMIRSGVSQAGEIGILRGHSDTNFVSSGIRS
jgi:hypothetical protein